MDDALSDGDDEDDDDDDEEGGPTAVRDDQESSSSESLTGDVPRGWKRKSNDLALDQDLSGNAKVRRIGRGGADNDDSDESGWWLRVRTDLHYGQSDHLHAASCIGEGWYGSRQRRCRVRYRQYRYRQQRGGKRIQFGCDRC